MDDEYIVYILKCSDGSFYTGITNNLKQRLEKHKSRKGSKYVAARLPFELVYTENAKSRSAASKREYEIKQMSRLEKEELVEGGG